MRVRALLNERSHHHIGAADLSNRAAVSGRRTVFDRTTGRVKCP
jgi:hypothetical protein